MRIFKPLSIALCVLALNAPTVGAETTKERAIRKCGTYTALDGTRSPLPYHVVTRRQARNGLTPRQLAVMWTGTTSTTSILFKSQLREFARLNGLGNLTARAWYDLPLQRGTLLCLPIGGWR